MPLRRKLTPAALPVLTTISWLARMEVCAGAMRVSSATGLASATMEIQAVFSARMSRVKVLGGFAEAGGLVFTLGGVAVAGDGFAEGLLVAEPVVDAAEDAGLEDGDAAGRVGDGPDSVVGAETVPGESVPAGFAPAGSVPTGSVPGFVPTDRVPAGEAFPTVREAVDPEGCVGEGVGVGAGG